MRGHRHAQIKPFQQIRSLLSGHSDKVPLGGGSAAMDLFGKASMMEPCGV